ncbi:MAG: RNA polymerase sporulation sigma factor SigK [Clostridiales bacterium]|jgi:RNA polymerase sporulation-specific sigma factor|nr:RNA polymerase sporulation sigma factor SigK [Clostridiales bacterium]
MLSSAFMLLVSSAFLMLRLGKNSGSFPKPLSARDEKKYLELWAEGDIEARNKLIEHNLRLVAHIVKKYYTQCAELDDLISIGTIGLIKGISSYKPDKGVRLATYASRCIENEVLMYFRSARKSASDISLSESIETDGAGSSLCLMDVVCFEEDMLEQISRNEMSHTINRLVKDVLDARESEIIRLRYGLGGDVPKTQHEVAQICGISRSYVSRIEKRALEKLRKAFEEEGN